MNYTLIILLLNHIDSILVPHYTPYCYLCVCLNNAEIKFNCLSSKEAEWLRQRIRKVIQDHSDVMCALHVATGRSSYKESYHIRKYLIRRWIGEARLGMSESTSSSVVK